MFRGVKSRFPRLLPILREDDVAARIVRAVQRDRRRLMLPPTIALLPLLRILPVGAFDWIAGLLGVNTSMDGFEGRGPKGGLPPG
jgi:all-trans-retinol dehydrogenase (NAD+)